MTIKVKNPISRGLELSKSISGFTEDIEKTTSKSGAFRVLKTK